MLKLTRRQFQAALVASAWIGGRGVALADMKALNQAAQKEGEVTWYVASIDAQSAEAAGYTFTAKHGLKVNVVRGPSQVMFQRLTQDLAQKAHNADVFSSVDAGNFVTLKKQDALVAYTPLNTANVLPPLKSLDTEGMFHPTIASVVIIGYRKDRLKAEEAPRSWIDLLDGKWAGKIALGHPAFSAFAGNWAAQMHKLYGRSFFQRLQQQNPQVARSPIDAVNLVSSGERLIAIAPVALILESVDTGDPLKPVYPADGSILVATPSAILKDAPHPNAAKLFMEFLLGREFSAILAGARYEVMRADVKPLPGSKPVTEVKILQPTIDDATTGIAEAAAVWREVFGQ